MSNAQHLSRASRVPRRVRAGRLLVECMVATVLLGAAGAAAGVTTRVAAGLVDDALNVSRARELMVGHAEASVAGPCAAIVADGVDVDAFRPRVTITSAETRDTATVTTLTRARIEYSPFAGRTPFGLSVTATRMCP